MAEIFIGSYILDMDRYFNPSTLDYTFSYSLSELFSDGLMGVESLSYKIRSSSVSEVLEYYSIPVLSEIEFIERLSDKTQNTAVYENYFSEKEFKLLKEKLLEPMYLADEYTFPIVLDELLKRQNTEILVAPIPMEMSFYYDDTLQQIKIENELFGQYKSNVIKNNNINKIKDMLSIEQILRLHKSS